MKKYFYAVATALMLALTTAVLSGCVEEVPPAVSNAGETFSVIGLGFPRSIEVPVFPDTWDRGVEPIDFAVLDRENWVGWMDTAHMYLLHLTFNAAEPAPDMTVDFVLDFWDEAYIFGFDEQSRLTVLTPGGDYFMAHPDDHDFLDGNFNPLFMLSELIGEVRLGVLLREDGTQAFFDSEAVFIAADEFTLEDLYSANSASAILERYDSANLWAIYFDTIQYDGSIANTSFYSVLVRNEHGIFYHFMPDDGSTMVIHENGMYRREADGTFSYFAFLDEGIFEEYYLPFLTETFAITPTEGEVLVSAEMSADGYLLVIAETDVALSIDEWHSWGLTEGTVRHTLELHPDSGLIDRIDVEYFAPGSDEGILLALSGIRYGERDGLAEPEFMPLSRFTADTRTVRFVRNVNTPDEEVHTFTFPPFVRVGPITAYEYEPFLDAEFTMPYVHGEFAEDVTVYMRRVED